MKATLVDDNIPVLTLSNLEGLIVFFHLVQEFL